MGFRAVSDPRLEVIEKRRGAILEAWERECRSRDRPGDAGSELLDQLLRAAIAGEREGVAVKLPRSPAGEEDARHTATKIALMRDCVFAAFEDEAFSSRDLAAIRRLSAACDQVICRLLEGERDEHERTLRALDRIAEEALVEVPDLDSLLQRLLKVLLESSEAVDEAREPSTPARTTTRPSLAFAYLAG